LDAVVEVDVVEGQNSNGFLPRRTTLAIIEFHFVRQRVPYPLDDQRMTPQFAPLWVFKIKKHGILLAQAHQLMHAQ